MLLLRHECDDNRQELAARSGGGRPAWSASAPPALVFPGRQARPGYLPTGHGARVPARRLTTPAARPSPSLFIHSLLFFPRLFPPLPFFPLVVALSLSFLVPSVSVPSVFPPSLSLSRSFLAVPLFPPHLTCCRPPARISPFGPVTQQGGTRPKPLR